MQKEKRQWIIPRHPIHLSRYQYSCWTWINSSGSSSSPSFARDARIEDGKLFYEKRWFRRGQTIYVEGKDGTSYGATISAIGSDAIWVRRVEDNSKVLETLEFLIIIDLSFLPRSQSI